MKSRVYANASYRLVLIALLASIISSSMAIAPATASADRSQLGSHTAGPIPLLTVTTDSDAADGDTSSMAALLANPGPDGISLREALAASNNTAGPETIKFAVNLKGSTIMVGSAGGKPLPMLTGGGLTLDGDTDGDGAPDITLDGSLGTLSPGPLSNGIGIWSDGNTIEHLRLSQFQSTIFSAVPTTEPGIQKVISGTQILSNTIETAAGGQAVGFGPLGLLGSDADPDVFSHLAWQDVLIAGNQISSTMGIFFYAGTGTGHDNRISSVVVRDNYLTGGGGIGFVAGDANSGYHHLPGPLAYSDNNLMEDVVIAGNHIIGATYNGLLVQAANMGNRNNQVRRVQIARNTIQGTQIGISLAVASGDQGSSSRTSSYNVLSDVQVSDNVIEDTSYGIYADANGPMFTPEIGQGVTENTLEQLAIIHNQVRRARLVGIAVYGAVIEHPALLIADNTVTDVTIRDNQVETQTQDHALGISIAGGLRATWCTGGSVAGNRLVNVALLNNHVAGFETGISVIGGTGLGANANLLSGLGFGNDAQANTFPVQVAQNAEGADNNTLVWSWGYRVYLPGLTK